MKRFLAVLLFLVVMTGVCGCGIDDSLKNGDGEKLSVVVTSFVHYDFVRSIAQNTVDIKMLIPPASEAHTYEPTPADMLLIAGCDLFVYTGAESDVWVENVLSAVDNKDMSIISFSEIYHQNFDDKADKHKEHSHSLDQHFWTNPLFSVKACRRIAQALIEKDGENKAEYEKNLASFIPVLEQIAEELTQIKSTRVRNKVIVADRFPFYHLSEFLGEDIEFLSPYASCSDISEPGAEDVALLSKTVMEEKIPYIFTIEFSNGKIAKSVSADVPVLTLHSCHTVSAEEFERGITYTELMKENVKNLKKALCD